MKYKYPVITNLTSLLWAGVALLVSCTTSSAQTKLVTATITGKITDSKNTPLAAASVYIKGTTQGTVTNSEGNYRLVNLRPGKINLAISLVGFATQIKPIELPASGEIQINISLKENTYSLGEVSINVNRQDPAIPIMKKAIAKRRFYYEQLKAYRCQVYIKGIQKLRDAPKKFLGQDIQGQLQAMGLDSGKRGILYLSESVSRLSFQRPGHIHEEMVSSKLSGKNNSFSFNQASDLMINFYEGRMDLKPITEKLYLSPLADIGLAVYRYRLKGTATSSDNRHRIYEIQVLPKRKGAYLFQGTIYIRDSTYNLEATDLRIADQSKIDFLDTLAITQQFTEPQEGLFVLSTEVLRFSVKIFRFNVWGTYLESLTDYDLNPHFTKADFPSDVMHISTLSNKKDSSYWNLVRPVPLSAEEKRDYIRKDSITKKHESKEYMDSVDRKRNKITVGSLLLSGQSFQNQFRKSRFDIDPLGFLVSYNTVEGLAFNPEVTYTKKLTDTTSVSINTNLRYGFVIKRFNPWAAINWNINLLSHKLLQLSGGEQMTDQNQLHAIDPLFNTYKTIFNKINTLKLYEKHFASIGYSQNITRQLNVGGSFEFARRIALRNTAYEYFSGPNLRHFSSNDPFSSPGNILAFTNNNAATINLFARMNFGEKFVSRPDMLISEGSSYPTLLVNYRKGIKGLLGSSSDYDYVSARVIQRNIPTASIGRFNYSIAGGRFLTHNILTYLDYQPFTNSQSTLLPRSDAFEILNAYKYSASEYFLHLHAEQNFTGSLLSTVPLLRKLRLEEILGASYMRSDKLNDYSELYIGIQRFNIRLSYTVSILNSKRYLNGFTFTLGGF